MELRPGSSTLPGASLRSTIVEDDALVLAMAVDLVTVDLLTGDLLIGDLPEVAGYAVAEPPGADAHCGMLERSSDIDALFTDVDMPGLMSGFSLGRRIAERCPRIRLVISSGLFAPNSRDMPEADRFSARPYSRTEVCPAFGNAA